MAKGSGRSATSSKVTDTKSKVNSKNLHEEEEDGHLHENRMELSSDVSDDDDHEENDDDNDSRWLSFC